MARPNLLKDCDRCLDGCPCYCAVCNSSLSLKDARLLSDVEQAWKELEDTIPKEILSTNLIKGGPGKGGAE